MTTTAVQPEPMGTREWENLWAESYEELYKTYYEEFVLEALLERWERASVACRFVVLITTPGSAISGWALWEVPTFKYLWAVIAGLGAVFAVAESVLHMTEKIKEQTILLTEFRALRTDIETFRTQMKINALPELKSYKDAFLLLCDRFSVTNSKLRNDFWYTKKVKEIAQSRLNILFPR
jgi:hypothetical protein